VRRPLWIIIVSLLSFVQTSPLNPTFSAICFVRRSVYENRDSLLARAEQLRQSVEAGANLETRRKQFGDIDLDNDGQISYKEFKKYLKAQASRRHLYVPSDEDVKELIAEVDTDRDGVISFDEFVAMMESDAKVRPDEEG